MGSFEDRTEPHSFSLRMQHFLLFSQLFLGRSALLKAVAHGFKSLSLVLDVLFEPSKILSLLDSDLVRLPLAAMDLSN